jgi:membrane associated rhomboid family serine protease
VSIWTRDASSHRYLVRLGWGIPARRGAEPAFRLRRCRTQRARAETRWSGPAEDAAVSDARQDTHRLRRAFFLATSFVGLLWLIKLVELLFGLDLSQLSIFPRRFETLPGIALAPLLHGSLSHLFANTAPILVLGTLLIYGYPRAARILLPAVYLGSGLGVWMFARPAWHLGASGLTFGMMFFIFAMGILRWDRRAIALALVTFLLYGGTIWGVFPIAPNISFEYHLFGAGIGILLAFRLKGLDPAPPRKRYSWEDEDAKDE